MEKHIGIDQVEGFGDETVSYQSLVGTIIIAAGEIIEKKSIPYDFNYLNEKMAALKIIRRDGQAHEYVSSSHTLYVSKCNQENRQYTDEEMIIFTTHELIHMISEPKGNDDLGDKHFGFNEFFTEYFSSLVVSKIGGIALETYYRQNNKGYFGNDTDNKFVKKLVDKVGLNNLLNCYLIRDTANLENLVGSDTLIAMNNYFDYCDELSDQIGAPLKRFNEIIEQPLYLSQKEVMDNYVSFINNSI